MEMQNYVDDIHSTSWCNLEVKIFTGIPSTVQKKVNQFLNTEPISIQKVLQTETDGTEGYGMALTLFFYREGKPNFVHKGIAIYHMAHAVEEYVKGQSGYDFLELSDVLWQKHLNNNPNKED